MQLPNADEAILPRNKLENYLLDLAHPIGGGKARFFLSLGFRREAWNVLADAFRKHAREGPVANSISDADGVTYLVEGPLETPSGRKPRIRTIWLIETDNVAPRFITAYPLPV
ncbi:MAG TPA: hypothetical protein VGM66_14145 [Candidatus Udaeobacter sp.]|jgi:hypothetical protein